MVTYTAIALVLTWAVLNGFNNGRESGIWTAVLGTAFVVVFLGIFGALATSKYKVTYDRPIDGNVQVFSLPKQQPTQYLFKTPKGPVSITDDDDNHYYTKVRFGNRSHVQLLEQHSPSWMSPFDLPNSYKKYIVTVDPKNLKKIDY